MQVCNVMLPLCCCCVPRRARRGEPARRGVCERQTPPGRGEAADRGAGPPGRPALRHLQTATGQSRLCQQNPRQVKGGGSTITRARMCVKHQSLAAFGHRLGRQVIFLFFLLFFGFFFSFAWRQHFCVQDFLSITWSSASENTGIVN